MHPSRERVRAATDQRWAHFRSVERHDQSVWRSETPGEGDQRLGVGVIDPVSVGPSTD